MSRWLSSERERITHANKDVENGNSCALLLRIKISTAVMQITMMTAQKIR